MLKSILILFESKLLSQSQDTESTIDSLGLFLDWKEEKVLRRNAQENSAQGPSFGLSRKPRYGMRSSCVYGIWDSMKMPQS